MKAVREQDVVRQCLQLLALKGVCAFRVNGGAMAIGEGARRRYVRFTSARGCSDVVGVLPAGGFPRHPGAFLAVECKKPGGRLTADQAGFLENVRRAGGVALVVHSVTELARALEGLAS
jgi:hypothetical protein